MVSTLEEACTGIVNSDASENEVERMQGEQSAGSLPEGMIGRGACISNSSKLFGELYNDTASECDDACSVAELGLRVFHVEMDDNEDWCVSETLSLCRRPVGTMIGTVMVTLPNPSALLFT